MIMGKELIAKSIKRIIVRTICGPCEHSYINDEGKLWCPAKQEEVEADDEGCEVALWPIICPHCGKVVIADEREELRKRNKS
jgi:ribosomal protein S27AE